MFMSNHCKVFSFVAIAILSGCATTTDSLRSPTAGVLGYSPDKITISDIKSDTSTTYYIAKTPKGEYACSAESAILKAMQLGLTNPPICNKKK